MSGTKFTRLDQENPMKTTKLDPDQIGAIIDAIDRGAPADERAEQTATLHAMRDLLTEIRDTLLAASGGKPKPRKPMPDLTPEQERRIARAPKKPWTPPAPADDLPGEPVEPGDLRAGDRVGFTWKGRERINCALVSGAHESVLLSDTPGSGGYAPDVVWDGEWCSGISDVRLIERAPREDESPDEAHERQEHGLGVFGYCSERRARKDAEAALADMTRQRDEWQARHKALREDVTRLHMSHLSPSEAQGTRRILDNDTERGTR